MPQQQKSQAVATVLGDLPLEDLGIVSMHEYPLFGLTGWKHDPWIYFNRPQAVETIISILKEFKQAGGSTIVDSSGLFLGGDVELLQTVSKSSGIIIIASTGLGSQRTIPSHFLRNHAEKVTRTLTQQGVSDKVMVLNENHLENIFFGDLTHGMITDGMIRSKSKANICISGSSWDEITEAEELSLRGAALAAKRTGVAVMINPVNLGQQQIAIMLEEGLNADRIVMGHCDDGRAIDLGRDKKVAEQGCYIGYDHIGWEDTSSAHGISDDRRVEMVTEMVKAGFTERIVLSCSAICYGIGVQQSEHTIGHLLQSFVPRLNKAGIGDSVIHTILVENAKRILSRKEKRGG